MVYFPPAFIAFAASFLSHQALAHPGHDGTAEMHQRAAYMATAERRSLAHCAAHLKARGHEERLIARRKAIVANRNKKRSVERRDFTSVLATDHHSNESYTPATPDDVIFAGNTSCILSPEVTEGPYYVSGELVRSNVTENEQGVPLTVDIQVLDVSTCEPIPNVLMDFWHCNSTGVYGGIVSNGNGNSADAANINNTALRGIQGSDSDGVLTFDTIVPGHYTGRTNHIHVLAHLNATVLVNNTVNGGTIAHVGQLFFDQSLLSEVEETSPYSTNSQTQTTNEEDSIMGQEAATSDPVLEYVLLGDTVADGIFGWISFGIDPSLSKNVSAAASYGEDGGHANSNAGGFGGSPPTGSFSGFPSGTAVPTA